MYVCLLAGLADRGIAGYSVGRARDAGLVLAAFATLDFPLTDVQVFHADRGGGFDECFASIFLKQFLHYFSAVWAAGFQRELHHMAAQTRTGTGPPCLYIPET